MTGGLPVVRTSILRASVPCLSVLGAVSVGISSYPGEIAEKRHLLHALSCRLLSVNGLQEPRRWDREKAGGGWA